MLQGRNTMRPGDLVKRYREAFGMKVSVATATGFMYDLIHQK